MAKNKKYIFVTGGVLSGVGKGTTAASIGAVLKGCGVSVSMQKCDPYLNVDAGLLNPKEHGECFVTKDGAETDLDLGHYERFLDTELTHKNITLSGYLFKNLIAEERAGKFNGHTVQLVPHLTNAIQESIINASKESEVHIVEIGGTVGDYEGLSFIEAIREFSNKIGRQNCLFIHVVYVPFIGTSKEFKTKPAQNAINDLRGFGIMPDAVIVRTENIAPDEVADKISLFGGIDRDNVILMPNVDTIYAIPLIISKSTFMPLLKKFCSIKKEPNLTQWQNIVDKQDADVREIKIGLVAKYLGNNDTYLSVIEAIKSAAWQLNVHANVIWINAEQVSDDDLKGVDGIVVPGGFGGRGVEGKIKAARYCLKNNKPYLGLCLGLQVAVIAAARLAGLDDANSTEFDSKTKNDVVYIMSDQVGKESTGGTMRLGNYKAKLISGTKTEALYDTTNVIERHRHRYEVNKKYLKYFNKGGLIISGESPDGRLVEFIESKSNCFFIATQAHPEFKSRPFRPHPLFVGLIKSIITK
jgi:CTP synthase